MNRRKFLTLGIGSIIAAAAAPAIVRADSLMRIVPRDTLVLRVPEYSAVDGMYWYTFHSDDWTQHGAGNTADYAKIVALMSAMPEFAFAVADHPLPYPTNAVLR